MADVMVAEAGPRVCFRVDREECPHCHKRGFHNGLLFGARGFAWLQRRHEDRCSRRPSANIEPPSPDTQFDSAASGPSATLLAATANYRTCRESDAPVSELQKRAKLAAAESKAAAERKRADSQDAADALEAAAAAISSAGSSRQISCAPDAFAGTTGRASGTPASAIERRQNIWRAAVAAADSKGAASLSFASLSMVDGEKPVAVRTPNTSEASTCAQSRASDASTSRGSAAPEPKQVATHDFTPIATEASVQDSDFGLSTAQIQGFIQDKQSEADSTSGVSTAQLQEVADHKQSVTDSDFGIATEQVHALSQTQTEAGADVAGNSEVFAKKSDQESIVDPMGSPETAEPGEEPEPAEEPEAAEPGASSSSPQEIEDAVSKEEEEAEAKMLQKLIFELCDADGVKSIPLTRLADMCEKSHYVAELMGVCDQCAEEACQKMVEVVGHAGHVSYDEFSKMRYVLQSCSQPKRPAPRLTEEQQIDLIFESCDVQNRGEISVVEFTAFCVKRPTVAAAVGVKKEMLADGKRRKRVGTDDVFALIDTDGRGKVSKQELRAFVWKQRAQAADEANAHGLP